MDVYNKAEVKPDAESKGRLLGLLRAFEKGEPTKRKFVAEIVGYVHQALGECEWMLMGEKGGRLSLETIPLVIRNCIMLLARSTLKVYSPLTFRVSYLRWRVRRSC